MLDKNHTEGETREGKSKDERGGAKMRGEGQK